MKNENQEHEIFGTVLGYASGNVPAYSSDYDSIVEGEYLSRKSFRSYYDGIYMGHKWQCVEFARRWMYVNFGQIFDDVAMAYDIFDLKNIRDVVNNCLLPIKAFSNGSQCHPKFGSLLIWQEGGEFEGTGHVAVIVEVESNFIRIAEQNLDHKTWQGRHYSRELKTKIGENGEYWISCSFGDAQILGWMNQTENQKYSKKSEEKDAALFSIISQQADIKSAKGKSWLNIANPDEEAFVSAMGGHRLSSNEQEESTYFLISNSAYDLLGDATNELHKMFMHATDYILDHEPLLKKFNFPDEIVPRIKSSWDNRLNEVITSRFDFAMTNEGLKVYEYNCDSASCYMEAAKIQGKWANHYKIFQGIDAGHDLFKKLVKAWKRCKAQTLVHIFHDDDPEEIYHSLFMKEVIMTAGLNCKIISDLSQITKNQDGVILDAEGEAIHWLWKTWAWETALNEVRAISPSAGKKLGVSDLLLNKNIMVYEPLWSLIPSNKAILPIMWRLFPGHPFLLQASFELEHELTSKGYVRKPIVGRCGSNITLFDENNDLLFKTAGSFASQDFIYQEYFPLPKINNLFTQICTFTAAGTFAGAGVRVDRDLIINKNSDCLALRVIDDAQFTRFLDER